MDKKLFWSLYKAGKLNTPRKFLTALFDARNGENHSEAAERSVLALDTPPTEWSFSGPVPSRLTVGEGFFTSKQYLRQQDKADWQHTDPRIQEFSARLIEAFRRRGIPLYAHSAYRTRVEQNTLYSKGRSKAHWPRAPHCQGAAVDIVHAAYHWDMSPDEWKLIGKVGHEVAHKLSLKLTWGGTWSFYDPAHWELSDSRDNVRELPTGNPVRHTARYLLKMAATQPQNPRNSS